MADDALTPIGIMSAGAAFVALIGFSPSVDSVFWSPKATVLPLLAGFGLICLVRLRTTSLRRAVLPAAAFLTLAGISALSSANRTIAVFGKYQVGTGLIFVFAIVGAWGIGANLSTRDRRLLGQAVAAGMALNVVVAAGLLTFDLRDLQLFRVAGRAAGLLGNPVYFGSVASGAVAAVVAVMKGEHRRAWIWAGLPIGIALQVSGSRFALLVAVLALILGILQRASVHLGLFIVALVIGAGLGTGLLAVGDPSGSGYSSTARLQAGAMGGGFTPRIATWYSARAAVAARPILGSGPGTFALATSKYRTASIARAEGAERLFADAHNLLVEYAVTVGLGGVVAMLCWLAYALRFAKGPFAALAVGILLLHLVQPQYVGTTPLAFLCLGAATRTNSAWGTWPRRIKVLGVVTSVFAVTAGLVLVAGDYLLKRAELDFDISAATKADALLPLWPEPASKLSKLYSYRAITQRDAADRAAARAWALEAASREPTKPDSWIALGELALSDSDPAAASRHFRSALLANPQSVKARIGLAEAYLLLNEPRDAIVQLRLASPAATVDQRRLIERLMTKVGT